LIPTVKNYRDCRAESLNKVEPLPYFWDEQTYGNIDEAFSRTAMGTLRRTAILLGEWFIYLLA
jgi:hypothetical protein